MTNHDAGAIHRAVLSHLSNQWPNCQIREYEWTLGPIASSISDFRVAVVQPDVNSDPWIYSSCGAWKVPTAEGSRYEFFLMAPSENAAHVEALAMLANFHADERYEVGPGSIVNLGRPWVDGSSCDHALISLLYMQGDNFEWLKLEKSLPKIRFLWLVPITAREAQLAKDRGIEAFEDLLEERGVDVLNFYRRSLI
jgi:hypothetical protein